MFVPSSKQTADHLKQFSDEVSELHPVLNALFRKMPGIEHVHYNQGPYELGADFLLKKADSALLKSSWIGVVAKVGQIRQNTSEVDRQIDECFITRKGPDSAPIQVREVWVVSSHEITNNAKEVLFKKYADKKVEFIGGQELATLIDRFAPESFSAIPLALQKFADETLELLAIEDSRSLVVAGADSFYLEPVISRKNFDGYGNAKISSKVKNLDDLLNILVKGQVSVVQAGAGGGKSRLARELTRRVLASTDFSDGIIFPITFHAKFLQEDSRGQLEEKLASLKDVVQEGAHPIVFIDGFDEIDLDNAGRAAFVGCFITLAAEKKLSVVLLSRPFNEIVVLGAKLHSVDFFQIDPLRGAKAVEFLVRMAGNLDVKSRIAADLGKSHLFKALDGTPIAYILLGRLMAENEQDLPSNLTELFQKYLELVLGRWEISKGLRSQKEYEVLIESLTWLAGYMLDNELPEVSIREFKEWISSYCSKRPSIDLDVDALVAKATKRDSVLFLRQDTASIGFRHRAFSEFFYARGLLRSGSINIGAETFSPYWINSFYFLAGLQRDCPELIGELSSVELQSDAQRVLRMLNFGNLLLAGYMTPTEDCVRAILKIAGETADVYLRGVDPSSKSPLSQLPTIQMLCAITTAFHSQFGYKHFKSPLEEAIYSLEAEQGTERNAVALFLLAAAYKEAGGQLRFDELIEKFGESLPLAVKLAIGHESERMKSISDRVKKMQRNLKRAFRQNKGSAQYLHKLYKIPVLSLDKKL